MSYRRILANRYEILRMLGAGGMGIVWLARDLATGKAVAIKEPRITGDPYRDSLNVNKLRIEAEILRNLNHEAIVKFVDYFIELGRPFLVMEYVHGDPIEKLYTNTPLNEKEILDLMKPVIEAVDHMHSRNIIHRDLKPKNIIKLRQGILPVKLIDFGTAKFFHTQLEYGEAIVSPGGYTAPEQYRFVYSPQSDIWSLGAVLFFLSTGKHPIVDMPGYPNAVVRPPNPRKFNKDVSDRIVKVIAKAMDPDPLKRYFSAREMLEDLLGQKIREIKKPTLIIYDEEIPIETSRVIIGRLTSDVSVSTTVSSTGSIELPKQRRVVTHIEGDILYVYVVDPKNYVSRRHLELIKKSDGWYLRDLGSLNKTAILKGSEWVVVHRAYRQPSNFVKLDREAIISLGYDKTLGPYLVIKFRSGEES